MTHPKHHMRIRMVVAFALIIVGALSTWRLTIAARSTSTSVPTEAPRQHPVTEEVPMRPKKAAEAPVVARRSAAEPQTANHATAESWIDAYPPALRAPADDEEAVIRMLDADIRHLYRADQEYVVVQPDGTQTKTAPDVVADNLELVGIHPVHAYQRAPDQYDYMIAAYRDMTTGRIGLIATLFVRDGVAVPEGYKAFRPGTGPENYPFLSQDDARAVVHKKLGLTARRVDRVFYPSPVSPKPVLFLYELETSRGPVYVSQDGAVWTELAATRATASRQ